MTRKATGWPLPLAALFKSESGKFSGSIPRNAPFHRSGEHRPTNVARCWSTYRCLSAKVRNAPACQASMFAASENSDRADVRSATSWKRLALPQWLVWFV